MAIKCGKCKDVHPTPADVAACYGVQRNVRYSEPSFKKEVEWTAPDGQVWVGTWFANTMTAIEEARNSNRYAKVKKAKNGKGVWSWSRKES